MVRSGTQTGNGISTLMPSAPNADMSPMTANPGPLEAPQPHTFEARMRVRILASLYLAGATLVLVTLALPHAPDAVRSGMLAIALSAYVVGGLMLWQASRLPAW